MMGQMPHIAMVGVFVVQASYGAYEAANIVIGATTPPPVEGTATLPPMVRAGELVIAGWDIVKRTDCPGFNSRVWDGANGFHVTEASKPTSLPTSQEMRHYMVPTDIPQLAPNGPLSLKIVGEYKCLGSEPVSFTLGPVTTLVMP